jgi:hypothetical protein
LLYSHHHLDATLIGWQNNQVFDGDRHESAALSVFYNRIPAGRRVSLGMGMTAFTMLRTSDEDDGFEKKGIVLSLTALIK